MPNNDLMNLEQIKTLSDKEKEYLFKILGEVSQSGNSETLEDLKYQDFKEKPVDIETFITDDNYLGKAWKDANGKIKMYPFWMEQLKKLFPNNIDTDYNTLLESGARGIGKSEIACGAVGAYLMYRIMCLKNPLQYYNLKLTEKIVFAFMNIKLALAEEIAVSKFQKTIQMSPWFMSKGTITQRNNQPYWVPPDPINIVIGSQSDDVIGKPIFYAFFDEISFIRNQDIDKQKEKAKNMIDTAIGGMMTRFIHNGKNPTMLCVASSKRSEQSFMEEYIKTLQESEGHSTLVIDKPVWEVKPKGTYSDSYFNVGIGNKFLESTVIPDDADLQSYKDRGYTILQVPIDFKAKALEDLERTLCDYAGISSASSNKFMSAERVLDITNDTWNNPLPDIIETGNGPQDTDQYYNYFNLQNVPQELMSKPLFIHLDMSISGDMTGIAGTWITGKKVSTDETQQAKDLCFRLAFSTSIKAPKGRQVSFEKNRNFIRWLKNNGFKIKKITYDTFQSYDTGQQLMSEGFDCEILSVDRVDTDHICKPYQYLKSAVYEKRFFMYKSERLFDEFVQIERNINTGKVDHPQNGHKDALDAVCGSVFTASKYADQYAFDYGEDLKTTTEVSTAATYDDQVNKINQELEQELMRMFNPIKTHKQDTVKNDTENSVQNKEVKKDTNKQEQQKPAYMNFGANSVRPLNGQQYLGSGIIVW